MTSEVKLTNDQTYIIDSLSEWVINGSFRSYKIVSGYAGTGKTTVAINIRNKLSEINRGSWRTWNNVAFLALTGKAASVMRSKIGDLKTGDYCGTIHKMLYKPIYEKDEYGKSFLVGWEPRDVDDLPYSLIIVDEGSMISSSIWSTLTNLNIPIIVFGDSAQLPPINEPENNLLNKPDYFLKQIHRQNLNNPIIKMATNVRHTGVLLDSIDKNCVVTSWQDEKFRKFFDNIKWNKDLICLCATNNSRVYLNDRIRKSLGLKKDILYDNERIVCLKNNYTSKIMNGEICTTKWIVPYDGDRIKVDVEMDNGDFITSKVSQSCFGKEKYNIYRTGDSSNDTDYFDFGYTISVHKSQGSEWDKVILFYEPNWHWTKEQETQWLYTAITRARKKIIIVKDF